MKKGFTLVELLAVIVILAVIMVISVPIVLNVINNSKKSAFETDVKSLIDITILNYETYDGNGNPTTIYDFSISNISNELEGFKGDLPISGTITLVVNNDRITGVTVSNLKSKDGLWCANKTSNSDNIEIEECQ